MKKLTVLYLLFILAGCTEISLVESDEFPEIFPDYIGVTIPEDLAGLRFRMCDGRPFKVSEIRRDSTLWIQVSAWDKETKEGISYAPFPVHLSNDSIDPYIIYSLSRPGGNTESKIYLRELSSYRTRRLKETECDFSERTDSCMVHSANGRWVLYSSQCLDGIYSRVFIAHRNDDGTLAKPFVLPQRLYLLDELCLNSFCSPAFFEGEVPAWKSGSKNLFK